jgi:hypothetical protein
MSWDYLQGKTWAQITRDERFFCQHLYHLILRNPDVKSFVRKLNKLTELNLNADADWEIGYEVCFYRDLWFLRGKKGELYSPKRTFDLCLFSAEEVVIIEAKAQQGFDSDPSQKLSFKKDKARVKDLLADEGVKQVKLLGLASSIYLNKNNLTLAPINNALFDGLISWEQLENHFGPDEILRRADEIYEEPGGSDNNEKYMTLKQILQRIKDGESFYVGCGGGFEKFMTTHRHDRLRRYETSPDIVASNNWFSSNKVIL